ncbi:tRNA synthetase B5 domain protein, partial [Chlamydia psittaci 84-8471/1]
EHNHGK